jgi:hypothetical protein
MLNLIVHPGGGPSPFLSRVPTLSQRPLTSRPHQSAAPPPVTVPRPTRQTSLSPLCFRRQRAHGACCPRAPRSGRCRTPSVGRGRAPRHPRATWHLHARTPTFSLLFSSLSRCRRRATTEPPASTPPRHPVHGLRVVTARRARCSRPCRSVAPLGWADRPWPSQHFGRPRGMGRQPPWAVASGRFMPVLCRDFKCFFNYFK